MLLCKMQWRRDTIRKIEFMHNGTSTHTTNSIIESNWLHYTRNRWLPTHTHHFLCYISRTSMHGNGDAPHILHMYVCGKETVRRANSLVGEKRFKKWLKQCVFFDGIGKSIRWILFNIHAVDGWKMLWFRCGWATITATHCECVCVCEASQVRCT